MASFVILQIACTARIACSDRHTYIQTDTQDNYCNPLCACAPRVKYESCGHVVTGDLSIIKDIKLRNLISKGPAYREQNSIDWRMNLKNLKLLFQGMQRSGLGR